MNFDKENFLKLLSENLSTILFYIICWTLAVVFISKSYCHIDLENPDSIHIIFIASLIIGLLFVLLPFFKRVKLGSFMELERGVRETKKELSDFKSEVRQYMSVLTTNINTIGNLTNQVTVNFPGIDELQEAIRTIKQQSEEGGEDDVNEIKQELVLEDEDNIIALARTRIRIEYLLRRILKKRISIEDQDKEIKFMSLNGLTKEFLKLYPNYSYLNSSFDYVRKLANAATHAQKVSDGQTKEALDLGARLIAILMGLNNEDI